MTAKLTWEEYQRIRDIKTLDLELCDFGHLNILNLGWKSWGKWFCGKHNREHVLCPKLCLPVSRNVIECELTRKRKKRTKEPIKPNKPYDKCACYICGKELKGASKKGVIKNRNNPSFWGVNTEYKVLCLGCLGKKYYKKLSGSKRKTFGKYFRRGYI